MLDAVNKKQQVSGSPDRVYTADHERTDCRCDRNSHDHNGRGSSCWTERFDFRCDSDTRRVIGAFPIRYGDHTRHLSSPIAVEGRRFQAGLPETHHYRLPRLISSVLPDGATMSRSSCVP